MQRTDKNQKSQKAILEQELQRANRVKWINADIIRGEVNNIDNIIAKNTAWINHLQSANRHVVKLLEIFNPEQTTISNGSTDEQTDRQTNAQTDGKTNEQTDRQTNGQTEGQTNVQTDGQTNGQTEGQTNEQTDGRV